MEGNQITKWRLGMKVEIKKEVDLSKYVNSVDVDVNVKVDSAEDYHEMRKERRKKEGGLLLQISLSM